ncbi:aspartate/glutamate racemase [Blastococcus sp. MG754426]|uniref:aspartate/glutamate racemase family protein n=1 Tax=Blastococcus sp. MG754426 TaxID=2570317 RepID=UPI001F00ECB3|nr:aspartate/glutamate racemase family protein [Blastococcus sp. MG754426]MCF6508190.1 aspartate/glutamate racemase [Blastococcus sp. MG754426]
MRTIGLLGGMSWESSALYYRLLNEAVRDRLGGFHSARCILLSVDFAGVQRLQAAGEWAAAGELLAADARALQDAGADLVLLCTNTMHTVADAVTGAIDVPEQPDRDLVHRVIYDELVLGVVREESRRTYQEVVGRLVARGAQGVVLGCTEIELLIGPDDVPVPTFPTTALHAAAAVRAALGEGPRCPPPLASSGRDPAAGRSSTSAAPPTIDR